MKHNPGLLKTAIPAILTAAAVYISLVYASRLTATFFDRETADQLVRMDINVTKEKPFIERTPPPSPEAVVAAFGETVDAGSEPGGRRPIILEPELEPEPNASDPSRLSLRPIDLDLPPKPLSVTNAASGETSADSQ